ncbi:MAG: hypothetical protein AMXMBFR56_30000 [Polyangiaceae bacterium]
MSTIEGSARDAAEARYRALFETMGPAVLLMRGPACIDCNPATLKLFGVERREEMLGKTPLDFAPELQPCGTPSLELVQQNIVQALKHGSHTFEWHSRKKNGEPFLMEVRFTPCGPPEEQLFLCIAVDISERRRSEQALKVSEERFRTIVERALEGILVGDVETQQVRYANPESCRLLGYSPEELLTLRVPDLHPAEARAEVAAAFARQASGTKTEATFPMLRKDGSVVEVYLRGAGIELDGRPCVLALFTDLTERRLTEAERLKAQKLEALGALAGGIAHDFNNLLQGIFGFIASARTARDLAEARAALDDSEQALKMATRLTSQLLTFSRGGRPMKRVVAVLPMAERASKFALAGSPVACRFDFPPELPAVEADEGQLEQVVQNIVINAAQSMPEGGAIRVSARLAHLPAAGSPELPAGSYVALEVSDTGIGIPDALLPRIFDPYFTTKQRGSGLGLATAYSVVRNHGGAISVRSEVGRGSVFTIFLPASTVELDAPAATQSFQPSRTGRVLVMDDDPMVRNVTVALLERRGLSVDAVADGAQAVERHRIARAEGRPFDVVLLDLTVRGGMGGVEAVARMRALDPAVKAIVSSGYSEDAAISSFRSHGFCAALRKPYTLEQLDQALTEQLGGAD